MTGPAPGKIPVELSLEVARKRLNVSAYIHVKGYSRAMVTHLDIEDIKVSNSGNGLYVTLIGTGNGFLIVSREPLRVNGLKTKKIYLRGLKLLSEGERTVAWLGFKAGGFYIGFRKEIVKRLEKIARDLAPEYFKSGSSLEGFF